MSINYVVAFYEEDRAYGGPEEGGWWFDCGNLVKIFRVVRDKDSAYVLARRANRLLGHLQRRKRSAGSMAYDGGRFGAHVFETTAPRHYPEHRPRYE